MLASNYVFYSFTEEEKRISVAFTSSFSRRLDRLEDIADKFAAKVDVRDRKYRLKTYKKCFIGSEALTCLMKISWLTDRQRVLRLGRELASSLNLFEHVTQAHQLEE